MKRVLVLDANQRSALAVTRSLGNHGINIITTDEYESSLAGCSRYSKKYVSYPSALDSPEQFTMAIADICKKESIDIVLPMTELTTTLLLKHRATLHDIELPFPDIATVNTLADKCSLMRIAESLSIPTPQTWYAENAKTLPISLHELRYPIVIKPKTSWLEHGNKWLHTNVIIAENPSDASLILESDPAFDGHPFMLQEYIPGKGEGIFTIYDNRKPLAFFAHRRLREKPPRGGLSVLSESVPVDPLLESYSRKILDYVKWHGVAMVEFRVTPDGAPYLMEINTRFWGSLQLAVDTGVDFPWLLYQISNGMKVEQANDYKKGIRLRWLFGDFDSLYLTIRDKEFSFTEKLKAIVTFIIPHPFKTRHEVNRWDDMGPFWWELKQYMKDLLK